MIEITYPSKSEVVNNWREKLTEGDTSVEGEIAIQQFIDHLEKDIGDWRMPRCGV